jgi:hypothetical protein
MFARSSQLSPNSFRRNGVIAFRAPDVADYHSRDVAFVNIGRDLLIRSWLVRDEDHRGDRRQNSGLVTIDSRSEIELNFQPNTDILCNRARFIITYLSIVYIHKKLIRAFSCPASQSILNCSCLMIPPESRNGEENEKKTGPSQVADAAHAESSR